MMVPLIMATKEPQHISKLLTGRILTILIALSLALGSLNTALAQTAIISEFMASNGSTIIDDED